MLSRNFFANTANFWRFFCGKVSSRSADRIHRYLSHPLLALIVAHAPISKPTHTNIDTKYIKAAHIRSKVDLGMLGEYVRLERHFLGDQVHRNGQLEE